MAVFSGFLGLSIAAGFVHVAACLQAADPFSIIALPDSQYYSKYAQNSPIFTQQAQWIVDQVKKPSPWNITFVSHLGDVVNEADRVEQWERANASMSVLGSLGGPFAVPYATVLGNHDVNVVGEKNSSASRYLSYFGPQRFEGAPWYGGADPSGTNSFQFFSGGGFEFLHIALEWAPNVNVPERIPSPLEWASQVILAHPTMPVILTTHEYVNDKPPGRSVTGDAIFDALVSTHDQIFLVLCGHFHSNENERLSTRRNDGEWHQISTNKFDRPVVEVLQDFQDYPNGGDGWLRIITFDLSGGALRFETYSPLLDEYQLDTVDDVGQHASKFTVPLNAKRLASEHQGAFDPKASVLSRRQHVRQRFLALER